MNNSPNAFGKLSNAKKLSFIKYCVILLLLERLNNTHIQQLSFVEYRVIYLYQKTKLF